MTNTTTITGVATLKQLNKECLTIDLTQVRYKKGYSPYRFSDDPVFDPNTPLTKDEFNYNERGENLHIKFGGDGSKGGINFSGFVQHPSQKWKKVINGYGDLSILDHKVLMFLGGKRGKRGIIHNNFTDAQILINKSTDEILGVLYAIDNDYLNEWLRQTIDPNILNNYDELHTEKEFEVLITTTTYSQEKVKVVGRTYEECVETMKQNDPTIDVTSYRSTNVFQSGRGVPNRFCGMKTTGDTPIPSSYEEWISLQEKKVA